MVGILMRNPNIYIKLYASFYMYMFQPSAQTRRLNVRPKSWYHSACFPSPNRTESTGSTLNEYIHSKGRFQGGQDRGPLLFGLGHCPSCRCGHSPTYSEEIELDRDGAGKLRFLDLPSSYPLYIEAPCGTALPASRREGRLDLRVTPVPAGRCGEGRGRRDARSAVLRDAHSVHAEELGPTILVRA